MQRNLARYNTAYACGFENQYDTFRRTKARRIRAARQKMEKDRERGLLALEDALKLTFVYSPLTKPVNYGLCLKYDKDVSFIPNTFQLETQRCFLHRKDMMKIGDYTTVGFITWIDTASELVSDPLVKVSSTPLALYRLSELKPDVHPAKEKKPSPNKKLWNMAKTIVDAIDNATERQVRLTKWEREHLEDDWFDWLEENIITNGNL
jgi:hypothetical protein